MLALAMVATMGLSACDQAKSALRGVLEKRSSQSDTGEATEGEVQLLTAGNYREFEGQAGVLVVVDFYADWCGPCRQLSPMLSRVAAEFGDRIVVGKLDVDKSAAIAKEKGVSGIPDLRFFRDGRQVEKVVGLPTESNLRELFEKHSSGIASKTVGESDEVSHREEVKPLSDGWLPPGMQKATGEESLLEKR